MSRPKKPVEKTEAEEAKEKQNAEDAEDMRRMYEQSKKELKIQNLESDNAHIEASIVELRTQIEKLAEEQQKFIKMYQGNITEKEAEIQRLCGIFAAKKKEKADLEQSKIQVTKQESESRKQLLDRLQRDIELQKDRVEVLRKFNVQKDDLHNLLSHLEEEIAQEQKKHDRTVLELKKKKTETEKDELKRVMISEIKKTKLQLLSMMESELHPTTKRTIEENQQMTVELQYQSREIQKLQASNEQMQSENMRAAMLVKQHDQRERSLATRSHFLATLVSKLEQKLKNLDEDQQATIASSAHQAEQKQAADLTRRLEAANELMVAITERVAELKQNEMEAESCRVVLDQQLSSLRKQLGGPSLTAAAASSSSSSSSQAIADSVNDASVTLVLTSIADLKSSIERDLAKSKLTASGAAASSVPAAAAGSEESAASDPSILSQLSMKDRERVLFTLFRKLHAFTSFPGFAGASRGGLQSQGGLHSVAEDASPHQEEVKTISLVSRGQASAPPAERKSRDGRMSSSAGGLGDQLQFGMSPEDVSSLHLSALVKRKTASTQTPPVDLNKWELMEVAERKDIQKQVMEGRFPLAATTNLLSNTAVVSRSVAAASGAGSTVFQRNPLSDLGLTAQQTRMAVTFRSLRSEPVDRAGVSALLQNAALDREWGPPPKSSVDRIFSPKAKPRKQPQSASPGRRSFPFAGSSAASPPQHNSARGVPRTPPAPSSSVRG